jgi:IS5 family transposase
MDNSIGAGALDSRIVLGAIIIKHLEKLNNEGCILAIQENLYMQY